MRARARGLLLIAGAWLLLPSCGASDSNRRGNPAVYDRIAAESSCADLQDEFDTAMDTAEASTPNSDRNLTALDYAEAAQDRMTELGC